MNKTAENVVLVFLAIAVCVALGLLFASRPDCDRDNEGVHRDGRFHRVEVCRCFGSGASNGWQCAWWEVDR